MYASIIMLHLYVRDARIDICKRASPFAQVKLYRHWLCWHCSAFSLELGAAPSTTRYVYLFSCLLFLDLCKHVLKSRGVSMLGYVITGQGQHAVMCDEKVVLSVASQGRRGGTAVNVLPGHGIFFAVQDS